MITTKVLENANMFLINSVICTFTVTKIRTFGFFAVFYNNKVIVFNDSVKKLHVILPELFFMLKFFLTFVSVF